MSEPQATVCGAEVSSDAVLLARCAEGDRAAATAFVLRHQGAVRRFLGRLLGPQDPSVDDIAQHTFLAALRAAGTYQGRASAKSWLFGIANNQAKMELRRQIRRRRTQEFFAAFRQVQPQSAAPAAEAQDTGQRIQQAVLTLPPKPRTVFVLCEVEGFTSAEASEVLGAPEGSIRRWRAEARAALRPQLRELVDLGEWS